MKALIAALALVTLTSGTLLAQSRYDAPTYYNQSPASPSYGDNGY
jgi:hypothetical protein